VRVGKRTRTLLRFENPRAVDHWPDLVVDKILLFCLWTFLSCICFIASKCGFVVDENVRMWKETAGDFIRVLSGVLMCPFLNLLKEQVKSTALQDSTGSK